MNADADLGYDELLAYCTGRGRVCPAPSRWNEWWERLPGKQESPAGWWPPPPLIMGGWSATDDAKRERFVEHLEHLQGGRPAPRRGRTPARGYGGWKNTPLEGRW
jgi:hypothetical protein